MVGSIEVFVVFIGTTFYFYEFSFFVERFDYGFFVFRLELWEFLISWSVLNKVKVSLGFFV